MLGTLRRQIQSLVADSPIPSLSQRLRPNNSISIFGYNGLLAEPLPFKDWCFISAEVFEQQLAYLSRNFDLISLDDAQQMLEQKQIKGRFAIVTFDDGFESVDTLARPILEHYSAPATIFLTPELILHQQSPWFTRILQLLANSEQSQLDWRGQSYPLGNAQEKAHCSNCLQQQLATMGDEERTVSFYELSKALNQGSGTPPEPAFRLFSTQAIQALKEHPLITLGCHLPTPLSLSQMRDVDKREQISAALRSFEEATGTPCRHFAYPSGHIEPNDQQSPQILYEAGIRSAVTMDAGPVTLSTESLRLNRYSIGEGISLARFKLMAHHVG